MFATAIHFYPSLIFSGKAKLTEWSLTRGSTLVGTSLCCKYQIRLEVNGSGKFSSLIWYGNDYGHRKLEQYKLLDYYNLPPSLHTNFFSIDKMRLNIKTGCINIIYFSLSWLTICTDKKQLAQWNLPYMRKSFTI